MLDLFALRDRLLQRIDLPVERGLVRAGAIRTCFYQAGRGAPLVLLHGAAAGALYWYPMIGPLGRAFRVTAPDMVGYGESDKPAGRYDRP